MGRGMDLMDVCSKFDGQYADVRIGRPEYVFFQFLGAIEKLQVSSGGRYGISFVLYPIHGKLKDEMIVGLADARAKRLEEQNELNKNSK